MPITQDRFLSVLSAASEYEYAFEQLCNYIQAAQRRIDEGRSTPVQAMQEISSYAQPIFIVPRIMTITRTLAEERKHFSGTTKNRNKRKAQKQAERRAVATGQVWTRQSPAAVSRPSTTPGKDEKPLSRFQESPEYLAAAAIARRLDEEERGLASPVQDEFPESDPFAGIDFDNPGSGLDPETRAKIEREAAAASLQQQAIDRLSRQSPGQDNANSQDASGTGTPDVSDGGTD